MLIINGLPRMGFFIIITIFSCSFKYFRNSSGIMSSGEELGNLGYFSSDMDTSLNINFLNRLPNLFEDYCMMDFDY